MSLINKVLNKILGVNRRYKGAMIVADSTSFLPNFSIVGNGQKVLIGENNLLGASIILETKEAKVEIGDNVYMGNIQIICKSHIKFGNNILVAWGATFYDHDSHSLDYLERREDIRNALSDFNNHKGNYLKNKNWSIVNSKPITIGDDTWIGTEALILKGVTIGKGAIVGAHSVVTKDVPPFTVVAGNPAKVVKELSRI